jgi:hypothetical protein
MRVIYGDKTYCRSDAVQKVLLKESNAQLILEEGEKLEVDNTFITNTPMYGARHPAMPWVYYVFCHLMKKIEGTRRYYRIRHFMYIIEAKTQRGANGKLRRFVERHGIKIRRDKQER